jgi:hypothetical protein
VLTLSEDHQVVFEDHPLEPQSKEHRSGNGNWSYDKSSKQYSIALEGQFTKYSLVEVDNICMLIKGDLSAADLRGSWFSSSASALEEDPRNFDYDAPPRP